jgi:GT2 family glycosyltransferase
MGASNMQRKTMADSWQNTPFDSTLGKDSIALALRPQAELVEAGVDDLQRTRWIADGVDPRFSCEFEQGKWPEGGWYAFEVDIEADGDPLLQPVLYPDYGAGLVEEARLEMPFVQSRALAGLSVVRFVDRVHSLRFDPSIAPVKFAMGRVRLRRLSRLRAAGRMTRALLKMAPSIRAKGKVLVDLVREYSAGGARGMADWLYGRYSRCLALRASDDDLYQSWIDLYERDRPFVAPAREPLISVVMPVYNTPEKWLRRCMDSVIAQSYQNWELCIANDASTYRHVKRVLDEYASKEPRIRVVHRAVNGHISRSSNDALAMAQGEYVALLDHDDELPPRALLEVARAIERNPQWKVIYSDEDKIDEAGRRYAPYFKPDWNYDLFLSQNCISHLGVYHAALLREVGGFRQGMEGSQDWDLALRCIERLRPDEIGHIAQVLYHWRAISGSTALGVDEKDYAGDAGLRAVRDHLERIGCEADAEMVGPGRVRVRRGLPKRVPRVSLIIPTRDQVELLRTCISSIFDKTDYPDFEVLIVDNQSSEPATLEYFAELAAEPRVKVVPYDAPFNYSAINNHAAALASGQILGLVNNDIEVESAGWLQEMVSQAVREDVGAVGAMLLYPNDTIQHAGVIVGLHGIAGHVYAGLPRNHPGQMGRALLVQEMSAVTAACLLVRKSVFDQVGGLDEGLSVAFNDIDFCLRVRARGYRNLWTPHAVLYHHESASRGSEDTPEKQARFNAEIDFMQSRWGDLLLRDPSYNPNLSLGAGQFELAFPPR